MQPTAVDFDEEVRPRAAREYEPRCDALLYDTDYPDQPAITSRGSVGPPIIATVTNRTGAWY
jgi:hypothetical protein